MPHMGEFTKKTHSELNDEADLHDPKEHGTGKHDTTVSKKRVINLDIFAHYHARNETSYTTVYSAGRPFLVELDPANYDKATYYFEGSFLTTVTGKKAYLVLWDFTDDEEVNAANGYGADTEIETGTDITVFHRERSAAFTPKTGSKNYGVKTKVDSGGGSRILNGRIVIVQAE